MVDSSPGDEPSPERRAIGGRISKALKAAGISQGALAKELGKVRSAVTGWVQGRTQPPLEDLAHICRRTGWSADQILGLDGTVPPQRLTEKEARELLRNAKAIVSAALVLAPAHLLDEDADGVETDD